MIFDTIPQLVPSSSGLGRWPLSPETRVRNSLGPPIGKSAYGREWGILYIAFQSFLLLEYALQNTMQKTIQFLKEAK